MAEQSHSIPPEAVHTMEGTVRLAAAVIRPHVHRLRQVGGGTEPVEFQLTSGKLTVGRAGDADIRLSSATVSRHHATLMRKNDEYTIIDMESSHGLYLNGLRVNSALLRDGDILQLANIVLLYQES